MNDLSARTKRLVSAVGEALTLAGLPECTERSLIRLESDPPVPGGPGLEPEGNEVRIIWSPHSDLAASAWSNWEKDPHHPAPAW